MRVFLQPSEDEETFDRLGKKTVARQRVRENRIVGSSIGLQDVGDWTFWKVRPPPKRKRKRKTAEDWSPCYTMKH
jgi:hypothetical protein